MVSNATSKLEMGPAVLGEWGKEGVKLGLSETDDVGSGFLSMEFEIELGGGAKGFNSGCRSGQGQGADNVGVWVNGGGFKGVWVNEGNASVGKQGGVLGGVDVVWGGPVGARKGKPGIMNSGLEAMVGDQGTEGDDMLLGGY